MGPRVGFLILYLWCAPQIFFLLNPQLDIIFLIIPSASLSLWSAFFSFYLVFFFLLMVSGPFFTLCFFLMASRVWSQS
jgi:hypothetical protein